MAVQRLHSAMAPIDVLTRLEMEEVLHKGMDGILRDRYRGVDAVRIPPIMLQGNGGTINLAAISASDGTAGPEQGDIWLIRRALVASSSVTDTARYALYRGSTPSDSGQYTNRQLFDAGGFQQTLATVYTTQAAPAVPATTVAAQNTTNQPYTVVITANGATITAVVVNGVTVGTAAGTYTVPAYGAISIAYTGGPPTWTWTAAGVNTATFQLGQQVGVAIYPSNKAGFFQPGEQLYAQVYNTTAGNTYILHGEAVRVPAEMKGKLLS